MKFLIDQNRSPRLAGLLRDSGHDAVHASELALLRRRSPSVILFRSRHALTAEDQVRIILDYLDDLESDLEAGAVVVVGDDRIRVRLLPLLRDD